MHNGETAFAIRATENNSSPSAARKNFRRLRFPALVVLGAVFLVASLPDATKLLAARTRSSWLAAAGDASAALKAALPPVAVLLAWLGWALAAYVVTLVLLAWRHNRPGLVVWGVGITAVSTCAVHGVAWCYVIAHAVGRFLAVVFVAVAGFLVRVVVWVATLLLDYLIKPYAGLFEPLLGGLAWAGAALVVLLVLVVAVEARARWARPAAVVVGGVVLLVGVVFGLRWLFGLVPGWFWDAVVSTGAAVLGWVVAVVVCGMVGRLFLDQLRSGAHAGSGRRGVVMGAIAVGSALAVLMFVGNLFDAYDLYPASVADWARAVLLSDAPKLDTALTVLVVGLCALGVLRNLGRMRQEPSPAEFRRSLLFTIIGAGVAGGVAALDKHTSD